MHKMLLNEGRIKFKIQPVGPVLVKHDLNPTAQLKERKLLGEYLDFYNFDLCDWIQKADENLLRDLLSRLGVDSRTQDGIVGNRRRIEDLRNLVQSLDLRGSLLNQLYNLPGEILQKLFSRIPDMAFVRTFRNGRYEPYIPGSSLKGIIRSHAERITRTITESDTPPRIGCCNPFSYIPKNPVKSDLVDELSCSDKFQLLVDNDQKLTPPQIYSEACPICKLFGCNKLKSRLFVPDGYSDDYSNRPAYSSANYTKLQSRDSVAIDRYTSGAKKGAIFSYEVEENAAFIFDSITIINFELWQLGFLGYIFSDFKDQIIRIGYGKSRGLGKVEGKVESIEILYYGNYPLVDGKIYGIGDMQALSGQMTGYGFDSNDEAKLLDGFPSATPESYFRKISLDSTQSERLFNETKKFWSASDNSGYINGSKYRLPERMTKEFLAQFLPERIEEDA